MIDEKQKKIDRLFCDIALRFAEESHCLRYHVAAIAVKEGRIVCTGINGTPPNQENCDDHFKSLRKSKIYWDFYKLIEVDKFKEVHHEWSSKHELHAECNCVGKASQLGISLRDSTIYLTLSPCINCSLLLILAGVKEIVYIEKYPRSDQISFDILTKSGIIIRQVGE